MFSKCFLFSFFFKPTYIFISAPVGRGWLVCRGEEEEEEEVVVVLWG